MDGKPDRRNKATFSNSSGAVYMMCVGKAAEVVLLSVNKRLSIRSLDLLYQDGGDLSGTLAATINHLCSRL